MRVAWWWGLLWLVAEKSYHPTKKTTHYWADTKLWSYEDITAYYICKEKSIHLDIAPHSKWKWPPGLSYLLERESPFVFSLQCCHWRKLIQRWCRSLGIHQTLGFWERINFDETHQLQKALKPKYPSLSMPLANHRKYRRSGSKSTSGVGYFQSADFSHQQYSFE